MEIEVKPKLDRAYVQRMLQYVVSAHDHKIEPERFEQFMKDAEEVFLSDMYNAVLTAFNKGREFERRNPEDTTK